MARILGPLVKALENVEELMGADAGVRGLVEDGWGGLEALKREVLHDFFR